MQTSPSSAPVSAPDDLRVSVVTFGPGDEPYEKFGHNMLVIGSAQGGLGFNWGTFEFQEGFVGRFVQGRLIYWIASDPAEDVLRFYINHLDRTTWEQELNLTREQKQALWELCRWNELPENRRYRYDYFVDNCSTRVRDAVDQVIGGSIKRQMMAIPSERSFRSETRRLTAQVLWLYTALDFVLGHPTDRQMTAWDEMFVPMLLHDRLNQVMITDSSGQAIPLVKSDRLLHTSGRTPPREREPFFVPWFLAVGVVLGTIIGRSGCAVAQAPPPDQKLKEKNPKLQASKKRLWPSLLFTVFVLFWALLAGVAGWILVYFWVLTDHSAVRPNENILQLSPLMLPMLVLVPMILRRRARPRKIALVISMIVLAGSVLGVVLKVLPIMRQSNWNMIALSLPANAGFDWAMWRFHQKQSARGSTL
jgi:hypothetical protein